MESAENQDKSPNVNPAEASSNPESLSKVETIKLLNDSIDRLESTIKDISKNSGKKLPSSESINTLINTTQELADAVASPAAEVETPVKTPLPRAETIPPTDLSAVKIPSSPATPTKPNPRHQTVLHQQQQKNRALTIIGLIAVAIAIAGVIWLWLTPRNVTIGNIDPATEIINPRTPVIETPMIEKLDHSVNPQPLSSDSRSQDIEVMPSVPETMPETSIPQDLTSPGKPQNLKIETIEPELTFTSEQTLVASLQTKLTELVNTYTEDLFNQIKVDLPNNSLAIEVTDNWYTLSESRQNKLANEILQRSRQLKFSKLQLEDSTGTLVARNPVIGEQIIILQHQKNP